jgi:CMP-N-acetylneuraminic acid synthetase
MSRWTELEHTAPEAGWSKPLRVSGVDKKQSNVKMSKEQSNPLRTRENTLRKCYERNRHYYFIKSCPFDEPDRTRVFGVAV